MVNRLFVVGDIHGHGMALEKLLHRVNYNPRQGDKLVLLGDYIDRGPDPLYTIGVVMQLVEEGAIALLGNHEEMYIDFLRSYTLDGKNPYLDLYLHNGGWSTLDTFKKNKYGYDIAKITQFIEGLPLQHTHDDFFFAHAGIDQTRPVGNQIPNDLLWIREDWWLNSYDGKETVVFGHTPTHVYGGVKKGEVWMQPNRICLDTSAGKGGKLTLMNVLTREYWQEDAI